MKSQFQKAQGWKFECLTAPKIRKPQKESKVAVNECVPWCGPNCSPTCRPSCNPAYECSPEVHGG